MWLSQMMDEFLTQLPPLMTEGQLSMPMRMQTQMPSGLTMGDWAQEYQSGTNMPTATAAAGPAAFSPADFARFQQRDRLQGPVRAEAQMAMNHAFPSRFMPRMGMGIPLVHSLNRPQYQSPSVQIQSDKGKGKMVELDDEHWEQQFAQIDLEHKNITADQSKETEAGQTERSVPRSETDLHGDFESIWRGIQAEAAENSDAAETFNMDQWTGFDDIGIHDFQFSDPELGQYTFEPENEFTALKNPYEEGMRIMREGGNLSLAALVFEAAVQAEPSHVAAWLALGSVQAQNEKETPAIRALEQALKLDPNNLDALMGLAISYTNEGYDSTAYRTLERWLSVKYPQIISPANLSAPAEVGFTDRRALHAQITDLFIRAAQLSPSGPTMDPDVQVGLGVLFYGAEEYTKAVDCFTCALRSSMPGISNDRSQLHLLWNRLGATLANSGRAEEAISAYEQALTICPNFVRARYNLGVSCINIGSFDSAVGHFLRALEMHGSSEEQGRKAAELLLPQASSDADRLGQMVHMNQSTNLYDTLRRTFIQMDRRDLADKVGPEMRVADFRGEFDF